MDRQRKSDWTERDAKKHHLFCVLMDEGGDGKHAHTHTHTHWMASTYINAMFIYLRQRHPSLGPFVHLLRLLRWEMYSPLRFDSTAERVCCDGRHTHTHTHTHTRSPFLKREKRREDTRDEVER